MNRPLRISQQEANFGTHGHPCTRGFPSLNGQPALMRAVIWMVRDDMRDARIVS